MDASDQGSIAWLVEPANRLKVGGLFLLLPHILIPAGNSLVVAGMVASGATAPDLALRILVNTLFWGVALSAAQAFVLRAYVPARSWFFLTLASIVGVAVADGVIGGFVIGPFSIDPMTYYRNVPPILRWLVISSSQWLVLRGLVRSAGLWIGATVFAVVILVVLQNALLAAGYGSILMFPLGGLAVGGAQTWCLLQFTRREAARRAAPAA